MCSEREDVHLGREPSSRLTRLIACLVIQVSMLGYTATHASDLNRHQRVEKSPQWNGNTFQNPERVPDVEWGPSLKMFGNYFFRKSKKYIPDPPLPAEPFEVSQWDGKRDLQFAWLGHATFLFKIDDKLILTDPVFSHRAGSFGWVSPKRYSETLASTDSLPRLDVVLITHNHPDHLDEESIKALIPKASYFIAPLAVGELLEEWGVSPSKIFELDWWQAKSVDGLTITAAPAKHTSERGIFDKNLTLWASYGIRGEKSNLYLSGDSGWFEGLYEIGEQLGPFDITFFEIGAYSNLKGQMEVHYTPEQAIKGHQAVRGKVIVPSGWGTFDLGLFPWFEPIERFLAAANRAGIEYLTPKIGAVTSLGQVSAREAWWKPYIKN